MKDFSKTSSSPDNIEIMNDAMETTVAMLPHPVSSAHRHFTNEDNGLFLHHYWTNAWLAECNQTVVDQICSLTTMYSAGNKSDRERSLLAPYAFRGLERLLADFWRDVNKRR